MIQDISYCPNNEIIVTVGGSEAIDIAIRAIVNDGDEVIVLFGNNLESLKSIAETVSFNEN